MRFVPSLSFYPGEAISERIGQIWERRLEVKRCKENDHAHMWEERTGRKQGNRVESGHACEMRRY